MAPTKIMILGCLLFIPFRVCLSAAYEHKRALKYREKSRAYCGAYGQYGF